MLENSVKFVITIICQRWSPIDRHQNLNVGPYRYLVLFWLRNFNIQNQIISWSCCFVKSLVLSCRLISIILTHILLTWIGCRTESSVSNTWLIWYGNVGIIVSHSNKLEFNSIKQIKVLKVFACYFRIFEKLELEIYVLQSRQKINISPACISIKVFNIEPLAFVRRKDNLLFSIECRLIIWKRSSYLKVILMTEWAGRYWPRCGWYRSTFVKNRLGWCVISL